MIMNSVLCQKVIFLFHCFSLKTIYIPFSYRNNLSYVVFLFLTYIRQNISISLKFYSESK